MQRFLPATALALLLGLHALPAAAKAAAENWAYLQPDREQVIASLNVVELLKRHHYNKPPLDDARSVKIYEGYLKMLDPARSYFTAADIAQFDRWRGWRKIAALVPIAVVARPGYDGPAHAARAMGWLRRFVRPAGQAAQWTRWRLPALVHLKLPPDPTSSTALRSSDPHWHLSPHLSLNRKGSRDGVTRRPLA